MAIRFWAIVGTVACGWRISNPIDGPPSAACSDHAVARALARLHHLSSDHDPLFEFDRWKANLRILNVTEIKTVPEAPLSHPFVGDWSARYDENCWTRPPFRGAIDVERMLLQFRDYYNSDRVNASLGGIAPACRASGVPLRSDNSPQTSFQARTSPMLSSRKVLDSRLDYADQSVVKDWPPTRVFPTLPGTVTYVTC